ncbi:MAG TPA: glycosyltransferase [Candidatus Acidoferrum sp.]|nr:glycosyltransferase [Candidatus Acidoferrum sp.]
MRPLDGRPIGVLELRSVRGTGGGPEKTILLGAARSNPAHVRVTVCYIRDDRDAVFALSHRAASLGIDYVELVERHSFDPHIWPQLQRLLRERRIDIVHSHDYKTDLLAYLLARRVKIHPLATAHGWTGSSSRERRIYYPMDKRLLARFPRVIAVSGEIRRELIAHGAEAWRVTTLLNGIDPDAFRRDRAKVQEVRARLSISPQHLVIGAVGRLEPQKRFDLLLRAFAPLRASRPDLLLLIVGDGSLRSALTAQARDLRLGDAVRFLGHREDIASLHQAFDLFVQSSDYEGTPNAVLEAMALETPVVATAAGGTAELAENGVHASIVPCGDPGLLSDAMAHLLSNPDAAKLRACAARRRIEDQLSFQARTRALECIYLESINDRNQPEVIHAA